MSSKIDWLMEDCDLVRVEEITTEAQAEMQAAAEEFLRAGGVLTWSKWRRLTPESKMAFMDARQRLNVEQAVMIGLASHSPQSAARVMAASDDGEMEIGMILKAESQRMLEEWQKEPVK